MSMMKSLNHYCILWCLLIIGFSHSSENSKERNDKCSPPCKVCAPWEHSCQLPARLTIAENPKTGYISFRNRTKNRPFEYVDRDLNLISDPLDEIWIQRFMLYILGSTFEKKHTVLNDFYESGVSGEYEELLLDLDETPSTSEIKTLWCQLRKQFEAGVQKHLQLLNEMSTANKTIAFDSIDHHHHQHNESIAEFTYRKELGRNIFNNEYGKAFRKSIRSWDFRSLHENTFYNVIYESYVAIMAQIWRDRPMPPVAHPYATDKCAIIIESRADQALLLAIKHTMQLLGPAWSLVIVHTPEIEAFVRDGLNLTAEGLRNVVWRRVSAMDWDRTSAFRVSSAFYASLPPTCMHVLVFEMDAVMLKRTGLAQYTEAAYPTIGAPWTWCAEQWCRFGGNGGVTLRNKEAMRSVISELRCKTIFKCQLVDLYPDTEKTVGREMNTEDVFLARELYKHRALYEDRMPSFHTQLQFSVETMWYGDPVFLHKVWVYHHPLNAIELVARAFAHYDDEFTLSYLQDGC